MDEELLPLRLPRPRRHAEICLLVGGGGGIAKFSMLALLSRGAADKAERPATGAGDPGNVATASPLCSTSTLVAEFTIDMFTLAMLIKGSVPHVAGGIAPVTAQEKPMLRKLHMKLLLITLALNTMNVKESSGCIVEGARSGKMCPW